MEGMLRCEIRSDEKRLWPAKYYQPVILKGLGAVFAGLFDDL